ncbi:MAG: ribosome biogenesis GTPase Der [Pseudomonadota bacterium]|nr:ribosome biogenesis GTPase Der [Pseudomonadota bacterium]
MKPLILILGYTNVGKSSLYNMLLNRNTAVVFDQDSVTRDCNVQSYTTKSGYDAWLVDSPGSTEHSHAQSDDILSDYIEQADLILYVIDAQLGLHHIENKWIRLCQQLKKRIWVIANKVDLAPDCHPSIYHLGLTNLYLVSVKTKQGRSLLLDELSTFIKHHSCGNVVLENEDPSTHIMLMGRPNVGKSTLTNLLVGKDVSVTSPRAGTTRDMLTYNFKWKHQLFTIHDTAGIRRQAKITDSIERDSVSQVLSALRSDVSLIIYMIDANNDSISDQDFKLIRMILHSRTMVCLAINKCDQFSREEQKHLVKRIKHEFFAYSFLPVIYISALHGRSTSKLMRSLCKIACQRQSYPTAYLTKCLYAAIEQHQPPYINGKRIKPRFMHATNQPFTYIISGNQVESLPISYQKYLSNYFQLALGVIGIDIYIQYKNKHNPYQQPN